MDEPGQVSGGGQVGAALGSARSFSGVAMTMAPGSSFGTRYRIESLIGEGGMGKVYRALDIYLGRMVALKLVRPELAADHGAMQRFKQELLLASRISHRNILRIHDLGEVEGVKFISMACVEGQDLHHLIHDGRRLPVDRAVSIARQILSALDAAHCEGVVHRDLKPANILIDATDNVYVSDFGLARSLEEGATIMTAPGQVLGTPRYMSPEQVQGKAVDQRSDLYSFGLILCQMLAGTIPFRIQSSMQMMYERVTQKPVNPKSLNPDIPDRLEEIILHCLEKDPDLRYQQAQEILADLEEDQETVSRLHVPWRRLRFRPQSRLALVISAVCLLLIALLAQPVRRMLLSPFAGTSDVSTTSPVKETYLAVLPFRVSSDDAPLKEQAEGVVEALSAKLFQMQHVHLASSSAVESAAKLGTLPKIAHSLGVKLLVAGTMQRSGGLIDAIVRLEDPETGRTSWTQEFRFVPADLLAIEDDIYNKLVAAVGIKLSNADLARGARRPTEDIDAYGLYLKARSILRGQRDKNTLETAIGLFNQTVSKDARFPLAYAGLCDAYLFMYDLTKDAVWPEKALGAAHQSESLDPNLPEVHTSLGSAYRATGKTAEAIAELKRALELAPNFDEGYRRLASAYMDSGDTQKALEMYRQANELNPYYWQNHTLLGVAYVKLAQYDKAALEFSRVTQLEPDRATGYTNLGVAYFFDGKWNESIQAFEKSVTLSPSFFAYNNLAAVYNTIGRYTDALRAAGKAVEINPNEYLAKANLGDAYRGLGQKDKALDAYDQAIARAFKAFQVNPRDADVLGNLAVYYARKADWDQALQFIRRGRAIDPKSGSLAYKQAVIYALAGKQTEALQSLKEGLQNGYSAKDVEAQPDFKELRSRPEFQRLLTEAKRKK
jgi:serine/threonine protein kinase/tetratricopeptide (TPR) repeat protein